MKKFPKIVQMDSRGQIVIPKDIRIELGLEEGTGFYAYTITDEGLLLKKIKPEVLGENKDILEKLTKKAGRIGIDKKNIDRSVRNYKKTKEGNLELI